MISIDSENIIYMYKHQLELNEVLKEFKSSSICKKILKKISVYGRCDICKRGKLIDMEFPNNDFGYRITCFSCYNYMYMYFNI